MANMLLSALIEVTVVSKQDDSIEGFFKKCLSKGTRKITSVD